MFSPPGFAFPYAGVVMPIQDLLVLPTSNGMVFNFGSNQVKKNKKREGKGPAHIIYTTRKSNAL
jgi:hypothetical protein